MGLSKTRDEENVDALEKRRVLNLQFWSRNRQCRNKLWLINYHYLTKLGRS